MELKQVCNDTTADYSQLFVVVINVFLSELTVDYTHPTPFSITFDTTSTDGVVVCIDVPTIDDMALEGDHNFSVSLISSNLENNVQLSNDSVTAVIQDNDSKFWVYQLCVYQVL